VGSWNYAQRAVRFVARIQVNAHREHTVEHRNRRLHMPLASFNRPWSVAGHIAFFGDTDRQILMPRHQPIGIGSLVEQKASYRERIVAQNWIDEGTNLL
jgi:hypothetical protein